MAALAVTNPTLLDLANAMDPNGSIATVIEILNAKNEILQDITFVEGNLPTGHRHVVRSGIPVPTFRKYYQGVFPTKSTTATITDNTGMLEAYVEIDKDLAMLNGNTAAFRMLQDAAHLEGFSQTAANTIFYGNDLLIPETFLGLSPRYNTLSTGSAAALNSENIINGAASGDDGTDKQSIWLIGWSPSTVFGIVPKGSKAGFTRTDMGEVTIEDATGSNGGRYQAFRTHYQWKLGLAVADWRYAVRICNIDKSKLLGTAASGANLPDLMFQAMNLIPSLGAVRPVFYMSRGVMTKLRQQLSSLTNQSTLKSENVGGTWTESFQGIPIRRCDTLAADEAAIA